MRVSQPRSRAARTRGTSLIASGRVPSTAATRTVDPPSSCRAGYLREPGSSHGLCMTDPRRYRGAPRLRPMPAERVVAYELPDAAHRQALRATYTFVAAAVLVVLTNGPSVTLSRHFGVPLG